MIFKGLREFTLVDYPGKLACTVFAAGDPFPSPWGRRVKPTGVSLNEADVFEFLKKRRGELEGVVLTGGEPTVHPETPEFLNRVKKMGFAVKLDTNGTNPAMLRRLFKEGLVDYAAMDVKAPLDRYGEVAGLKKEYWVEMAKERVAESVDVLKERAPDYEFRTTVVPGLLSKEDVTEIARWIAPARRYFLQEYRHADTVDPAFEPEPKEAGFLEEILRAVEPLFDECRLRRS